ncbi:Putative histone deacetylase complex subunit cti6 [Galdieria sulphuraria]|nr:Putative histone deacetylase complex subunit cti6 [Galdieria sulphuraria]
MSLEEVKANGPNLEDFTEDAFVAASSLADLALSGGSKEEVREVSVEQPSEPEISKQMGKDVQRLPSFRVEGIAGTQFTSTACEVCSKETDTLINTYDDVGDINEPEGVTSEESKSTGTAVAEGGEDSSCLKVTALNDSRLSSHCLTFEDSESGSDDSFRREVGLKEKSASVEDSKSTPAVDEEEEELNSEDSEEKTRCPCGRIENFGTMIQCDECRVWQHAKCVGFRKLSEIPEQYFCEECRPDLVRENSIIYRKKYMDMKRSRKVHTSRSELERLESMIEDSEVIKSSELKCLFCKDLKKKYQTSSKVWDDGLLFRKYCKYMKDNNEVEKECIIAGLEVICGLARCEVEERLAACEKDLSEKDASDAGRVKEENEESRLMEPKAKPIPAQERVKKRKRTSILNDNLEIGDKMASSREERKMQQILLQFKRLEEREEKRKHKSSGHVSGTSLSCGNSDDNLSARFKKTSNRTASVDSDEKYSSMMEADEDESERLRAASIRDCLSTSSREMDDFKVEERIWEEGNPNMPFLNLPGPSIVGSTMFSVDSSQSFVTSSWTGSRSDSVTRFQGFWKKEKLLKLFRESLSTEQQDNKLYSLMANRSQKSMSPPVKKKVLMDVGSFSLSPASSYGVKTSLDDKVEYGAAATSSSLLNITLADDSNSDMNSLNILSRSRTSDSLHKDSVVDSIENISIGNSKDEPDGRFLKKREPTMNVDARGFNFSNRHFHRGVYNASLKDMEVDSTFSSNIRRNFNRDRSHNNESSYQRRNGSHNETGDDNAVSSNIIRNIKGRSVVGAQGDHSRYFREVDRNRKANFRYSPRQWSPNKKPRRNFDAWRDFRKQNGWH